MKRTLFAILLSMTLIPGITGRTWEKFFHTEEIKVEISPLQYLTLDNGINVFYKQNNVLPKISLQVIINGGECEESDENAGVTSLWGNAVTFSGSARYPREKLSKALELRGSEFVFQSSLERSIFSLNSLAEYFEDDLSMITEVIKNPAFNEDDLNLLKTQTLQSLKKRTENPAMMAYIASKMILWKNNVRGNISTEQTVKSINRSSLVKWNERMVSANRVSILVTGDFDVNQMKELLNKTFKDLKTGETKFVVDVLEVKNPEERKGGSVIYKQSKEIPQTTILFKAPGIEHSNPDYYAMKLYDYLLGGNSFNSYLTQVIRVKNGWAYSVYSNYGTSGYTGSLTIFTQTQNANVPDVINEIEEILKKPESFINEGKLAEAKNSLNNSFVFFGETPEKMASLQLSLKWDNLDDDYLKSFLDNINKVTVDDIIRTAGKYYKPENFFISVVGPESVFNSIQSKNPTRTIIPFKIPE